MAAEVPISDVLCEAMEYLSKLGSNLRTRSENLRDKRIRKDKLKNTRAVQKAASKVLLICELSKKSLDNVETGVRKVLSLIEASQGPSSIGAKLNDTEHEHNKYHYFEYRSRKLRIASKIELKHYMSAEVIAHKMPTSVQEKYPVYYDCKLKQQRMHSERVEYHKLKIKINTSINIPDKACEDTSPISSEEKQFENVQEGNNEKNSDSEYTQQLMDTNLEKQINDCDENIKFDRCNSSSCKDINRENDSLAMEICEDETPGRINKEVINKRVRFSDIYSDSNDDTQHNTLNENSHNSTNDSFDLEPEMKRMKVSEIVNSGNELNHDKKCNETDEKFQSGNNDSTINKSVDSHVDSYGEPKPQIRCVNLSKLLKPNALINDNWSNNNIANQKLSNKAKAFNKNDIASKKKSRRSDKVLKNILHDNDQYWSQKKKEVADFKAKMFSINIEILPDLTNSFLLAHKLRRVFKNGSVICEIAHKEDTLNSQNIKEVKNALLNDSDSEDCNETVEENKLKKSLLKGSDSENNASDKTIRSEANKNDKIIDIEKSVSSKSKKREKTIDIDLIKNSLLNESDSENNGKEDTTEKSSTQNNQIGSTNINKTIAGPELTVHNNENDNSKQHEKVPSDKENEEQQIQDPGTPTKSSNIRAALLNDSPVEKVDKSFEETPSKTNARLKSFLLNDSSSEGGNPDKIEQETPSKTNAKIKHSLLNDSSDEKTNEKEVDILNKTNAFKSLLDGSSDIQSDTDVTEKKRKTPKSKRKYIQKCRESKRKLYYSSSSDDNKQEKHSHKSSRQKSYTSSSSSSEDIRKKRHKKRIINDSDSYNSDNANRKSNEEVHGADNEQSDSNVDKMVRSKAKPSGSSSQISDNQDSSDKDIDRLTNLNSLNKNRRDTSLRKSNNANSASKNQAKTTPILGGDLLKAEASSESASEGENEVDEELPPVKLLGLNGDVAVNHMVKDDLLEDTDSSGSQEKEQSENADDGENTDEDTNVKSRRRKPLAISSDSEGGSNRRKQNEEKMSDFEDSEDESSDHAKKSKRKKKVSDSDASVDSSEGGQKKRRRIKTVRDSDASGSDTENEGRNKHGRKNIRKVMGKNQLEEATKKAAREEKERIARIAERQKMYNNLDFDESGKPDEVVLDKVVLDFDPETKEPLIQVDRGLVKKLKPHQANGIKFMWDACFESVKRIKKDKGSGCILAHCMGLGKTLQVISLTHTLLTHGSLTGVNRVLVVCPLSTVLNWVNEFNMWLKHAEADFDVDVYELSRYKQNSERAYQLQQWFDNGGVCVLGYEMFRNLSADNPKKFKKKMLKSFQQSLVDPGPDLVVCDEGHLLKNEKTSLSQSMNRVTTLRRIVLTGTPLQNNLKEYYCMVQFVKPNLLGKYSEYLNRFVNPITNGQYTDSTEHDIRIMKRRSHVLHKMLDGAVQRRDYGVLAPFLPPKHEYVLFITLTDVQIKLYQHYLDNYSRKPMSGRTGFLFPDFQSLQRIWTHPLVLKYNSERYEIMQQKKREREEEEESDGSQGSLAEFIDDDSSSEPTTTEESTDDSSDASDDSRKKSKKKKSTKKHKDSKISTRRGTRANPVLVEDVVNKTEEVPELKNDNPTEWWIKLVDDSELDDMRNSHKLVLLFDILRQCENIGDKLLVFSQSLYSLDLIEHFLGKVDEATQEGRIDEKLGGHVGSWSPGIDYFRLDGSTSCENRSIWCKNFNREDNPRARLFLISTRAGGLGINLVAANRVVIFDVSWNPSHDVQSIFRVYRFGQKKPCYVYRFLAMGTMEEKIYERQVTKQAISKRVIDEQQIDRHYAENDLAELYKFEARPEEPRPLPTLPKDRLFAEMLKEHEAQIYKYHEHDSLLENKEEETLSEEERKAAWEDFENEKTRPPPAPFPAPWPMHNGMGLFAQQQQMAYVALANLLRNDMPNINDNQIRDRLSLLLNSPSVMQKVNDAYKYMPGMMNPGMMNSMPAEMLAAGSGGGGTSGLQYEPPWQRQQQQQQQMRLQQLMQQQNPMGAKYYAGGLGSRDPVAMALQQQRAREFMMGGGGVGASTGSRPRGRPPMQPRVPTATSQDIVNLDSD